VNEDESQFSGLLLFADAPSMHTFLEGELAAAIMDHPALSDFVVTPYSILAEESRMTRAPLR